ncbi:alkene reductase [Aeromicrobium chenweiae]|uniref:Alkene reductase n=1 Tax=Aeromicrobium chenweiae TaxID=2079793 RepID=A0A2S0WMQ2_9ACTN|nr:alkene reductase [Aeromicrobium chenweiae]AWB92591.1 alkene reductase [Aeromicrobium chenweiae]TGN33578.1 alkene reductase [Aeromicrobium chenweiae]
MQITTTRTGSTDTEHLLSPVRVGALELPNRVLMAPMTRKRADEDNVPIPAVAEYYAQRATAGLIITEAAAATPFGAGYGPMVGFFTTSQGAAWREVVDAVHAAGGRIALQLWHVVRARTEEDGAGKGPNWVITDELRPEQLTEDEILAVPRDFGAAARRARELGFDAVELHAGSGNLMDRFLRSSTNRRTDGYGATAAGRARLLLESIEAIAAEIGSDRTGVKLSPIWPVDGRPDPSGREAFAYIFGRLTDIDLAYVHVNRVTDADRTMGADESITVEWMREHYAGTLLAAGAFTREDGERAVASGVVDAVVYGRPFAANPDLPARFAANAPLNGTRRETFYTNGPEGLIDYPTL